MNPATTSPRLSSRPAKMRRRPHRDEVVGTLHLLIGGGTETTANVLCHTVIDLLDPPGPVGNDPFRRVGWDAAWDEEVRKDGAVGSMPFRCAIDDIEIGGVTIAKGDLVLRLRGGLPGSREVRGYSRGVRHHRTDKANLSFGYGRHRCLGPALASMEAMVALPALFERFPDLALSVPPAELNRRARSSSTGTRRFRCG